MASAKMDRQALIDRLSFALRDVSGQGTLYGQAVAARLGINSTDLECLDVVVMRGPLTAGALAKATALTTGAITGVIDRLERAGFVRRELDGSDRRKVVVRALPDVNKRVAPMFEPMLRAVTETLASYDIAQLTVLLDFITRACAASDVALAALNDLPKAPSKGSKPTGGREAARRSGKHQSRSTG